MNAVSTEVWVGIMRSLWLILCSMMILSRFAFQYAGPSQMRTFLDRWKVSTTHRIWGYCAFGIGVVMLLWGITHLGHFTWQDIVLGAGLVGVLVGDGFLNFAPSAFSQFKDKMQDAWVKHSREPAGANDAALFGTLNLLLGLASTVVAGVVILYRPISAYTIGASMMIAAVVTGLLIVACNREATRVQNHR